MPLGRKHFRYGANVSQMELLGILMCESLMCALPKGEMGAEKYELIHQAFFVFFKVIVYWLQAGTIRSIRAIHVSTTSGSADDISI